MSYDEDDDDAVVPAGTRRSSYVPPTDGEQQPSPTPQSDESERPSSSTGSVPTIAPVNDDAVAQTPVFAESVETVWEGPSTNPAAVTEESSLDDKVETHGRDQFGLPIIEEPIDIPQVVVTDPLPDAVSGTGTEAVFDDNRLFPAVATGNSAGDVSPEPEAVATASSAAESVPAPLAVPERQSLTPEQLADVLGANGGLSSNDQMALLDAQIPLREADIAAIQSFMSTVGTDGDGDVIGLAEARFGDLAPELFGGVPERQVLSEEFTDDSTPVTGIPVITHTEIVEIVEDESGDVVSMSITEIDEVGESSVVRAQDDNAPLAATQGSDQGWNLASPAEVVDAEPTRVERRRWWALLAGIAVLASTFVLSVGATAAQTGSAPAIVFVAGGLTFAVLVGELARRGIARTGQSWRVVAEQTLGLVGGRTTALVVAVTLLISLLALLSPALSGLGTQVESSAVGSLVGGVIPEGTLGASLVAATLFVGAVVAALPLRWFRAKILVLTGWTAVGTASVAAMGGALLAIAPAAIPTTLKGDLIAAGAMASASIVIGLASVIAFHSVSRVRDNRKGVLWLSIGLALGALVLTGTVVSALVAADGDHFFFGNNPVVHIIAPSTLLNVVLGATALGPALLLTSTLVFRFLGSLFTRDDRDNPPALAAWLLVLVPIAWGAVAYLSIAPVILDQLPSLSVLAVPIAAVVGILAARGVLWPAKPSGTLRRWNLAVVIIVTTLGYGYASSDVLAFSWVGFANTVLGQYGFGVVYVDALVVPAALVAGFLLALVGGLPARRRSARVA